ncbi:MAG: hypothetical protein ACT4TC_09910 [Myxococcaceae bacterium]
MKTHRRAGALALLVATLIWAPAAGATVDAYLDYFVAIYSLQTERICLMPQVMHAEFGIPQGSLVRAVLAPTQLFHEDVFNQQAPPRYVNVNLSATVPPLVATYVSDNISASGVAEYEMQLDVSALAQSNGPTIEGRSATVQAAKLFLLALARSFAGAFASRYRLFVEFIGLPAQQGLLGTALPARTRDPYTETSPLLNTFRRELLFNRGNCR